MNLPLVSVVLPTHNRVGLLRHAVGSVLAQTERDFEFIVIDDASTDGTSEYLAGLAKIDSRVIVVRNDEAKGGAGARNVGILKSSGKWIAFLDDDDEWVPAKLQRQLEILNLNPAAIACSCYYIRCYPSGATTEVHVPQDASLAQLLHDNCLGSASLCIGLSTIIKELGGFDAKFKSGQDMDMWVRLRQKGDIVVCSELLVRYRVHQGPRISNNMQAQYAGARYFYFKHRKSMDLTLRRRRIANSCFIMSRQPTRSLRNRIRYLVLSCLNATPSIAFAYARSSVPRIIRDAFIT